MPSPDISIELRQSWSSMSNLDIKQALQEKNLSVRLMNEKNRHFKITGDVRTVELYATTGTVNAVKHGRLKPSKAKLMMPERAFSRVLSLANIGH